MTPKATTSTWISTLLKHEPCPKRDLAYPFDMRLLFASLMIATPAFGWEAASDGPVCLLSHDTEAGSVVVSHDTRKAQPYAIQLRRAQDRWIAGDVFALRFDGLRPLTITSRRHQLFDGNTELVVTDRGFENVLRGLEANFVALAILGGQSLLIPLEGAAPEVAKFRACAQGTGV